ncbi:hypothetical protein C8Q74DRAFT_935522 [Fomes fomentarius]|nr:hypothetical protein C8Q74DRAFT_935522 [Fomes fomentarius]
MQVSIDAVLRASIHSELPVNASKHHALQCRDIVFQICDQVVAQSCDSQRMLAALASVCKAFHEPALKALWARLPSFLPLLLLLSSSVGMREIVRHAGGRIDKLYFLSGAIIPEQWARFQKYAQLVHAIIEPAISSHHSQREIFPSTWTYLSKQNDYRPLVPALDELQFNLEYVHETGLLALLVPSLLRLTIRYSPLRLYKPTRDNSWEVSASALFAQLIPLVPQLTHLALHIDDVQLHRDMLVSLPRLMHLRSLQLLNWRTSALGLRTICALSSLPHLEDMRLCIESDDEFVESDDSGASSPLANAGFSSLKQLHVTESSSGTLAKLLRACSAPSLRSFGVLHIPTIGMEEWRSLCDLALQRFSAVTEISWYLSQEVTEDDGSQSIVIALSPLLSLGRLQRVNLKFGQWFIQSELSDAFYETLAKSWPNLIELEIRFDYIDLHNGDDTCPTLRSLTTLATHCPHLQRLSLPVLSCDDITESYALSFSLTDHGLQVLDIGDTLFGDTNDVRLCAVAVDRLFPKLDVAMSRSTTSYEPDDGFEDSFYAILRAVELCQWARQGVDMQVDVHG